MTRLSEDALLGANDAVARLLIRTLTVPLVFFNRSWPEANRQVDVLAFDRAGSGDVHVVEVKLGGNAASTPTVRQVSELPGHYRWLAIPTPRMTEKTLLNLAARLHDHRIGLIRLVKMPNGEFGANLVSRPVRTESFDYGIAEGFLKREVPDVEFGERRPSPTQGQPAVLPEGKVQQHLEEAGQLFALGHKRAAYLLAWSAAEAIMRRQISEHSEGSVSSPGALIRIMVEGEVITSSEAEALRTALSVRSALAHGLDDPGELDEMFHVLTTFARKLSAG